VLTTPGADRIVALNVDRIRALTTVHTLQVQPILTRVHVACRGGRHRSVAVAEEIARELRREGIGVEVYHRDIDKPVGENCSAAGWRPSGSCLRAFCCCLEPRRGVRWSSPKRLVDDEGVGARRGSTSTRALALVEVARRRGAVEFSRDGSTSTRNAGALV